MPTVDTKNPQTSSSLPEPLPNLSEKGKAALRPGRPEDAPELGSICYRAFNSISGSHNFPPDFPNAEIATVLINSILCRRDVYSVVAEENGRLMGSNFLWENGVIAGVGPITVDPAVQNGRIGRVLMEDVLSRARKKRFPSVRLLQAAYHNRSLALYTKLGFDVREPIANIQGTALQIRIPGFPVRKAVFDDVAQCEQLCIRVHGHSRTEELVDAIKQETATVVEYNGRLVGYATLIGFFGHAVTENNEAMKALIGAADAFHGPGFLLPSRNSELFRWCLGQGLRVVQPMTLMSLGLYNNPSGVFLPSILY